jgi:hypothetical protein
LGQSWRYDIDGATDLLDDQIGSVAAICLVANSLRGERILEVQLLEASEAAPSHP